MRINHNIPALRALTHLNRTDGNLTRSLNRLSSGKRINYAEDDAAGFAISHKLDVQVAGLDRANRNALDGISMIQTAEGALNEVHAILQRMKELSVQAANGTMDANDRRAIRTEVFELQDEILRISQDTEFNEKKLLNGSLDYMTVSSDATIAEVEYMGKGVAPGNYEFEVVSAATQTGDTGGNIAGLFDAGNQSLLAGEIEINGQKVEIQVGDTGAKILDRLTTAAGLAGLTLTSSAGVNLNNGDSLTIQAQKYGPVTINVSGDPALLAGLGLDSANFEPNSAANIGADVVIDPASIVYDNPSTPAIEGFPAGTTVSAQGNTVVFKGIKEFEIQFETGTNTGVVTTEVIDAGPAAIQVGANQGQTIELRIQNISPKTLGLGNIQLNNGADGRELANLVNIAIKRVSAVRGRLGAYQNRLEYTTTNLQVAGENMTASLSRILDTDMAYEMTQYTQQNIIKQAGTAMLAQANQRPQSLMQLLQG